jgi:hypothetical protein
MNKAENGRGGIELFIQISIMVLNRGNDALHSEIMLRIVQQYQTSAENAISVGIPGDWSSQRPALENCSTKVQSLTP